MAQTGTFTRVLAWGGTLLAWLPVAVTLLTAAAGSIVGGVFRFDYLMPAELFPAALAGGGLLLWAALRARSSRRSLIAGGLAAMLVLLVGGQAAAVATGLADGRIEPAGWPWLLVLGSLAGYALALVVVDCGGVLLLRDLFRRDGPGAGVAGLPQA